MDYPYIRFFTSRASSPAKLQDQIISLFINPPHIHSKSPAVKCSVVDYHFNGLLFNGNHTLIKVSSLAFKKLNIYLEITSFSEYIEVKQFFVRHRPRPCNEIIDQLMSEFINIVNRKFQNQIRYSVVLHPSYDGIFPPESNCPHIVFDLIHNLYMADIVNEILSSTCNYFSHLNAEHVRISSQQKVIIKPEILGSPSHDIQKILDVNFKYLYQKIMFYFNPQIHNISHKTKSYITSGLLHLANHIRYRVGHIFAIHVYP